MVVGREDRKRYNAGAGLVYEIDELSDAGVKYTYSATRYDTPRLIDNRIDSVDFTFNRYLKNERDVLSVHAYSAFFDSDVSHTQNYGLSGSWNHTFSEGFSLTALVGLRYTLTDFSLRTARIAVDPATGLVQVFFDETKQSDSDWGYVASLQLNASGEFLSWTSGYLRDLVPGSYGVPVERQRLYARVGWSLTPRLNLAVASGFSLTEADSEIVRQDSRHIDVTPSLTYKLTDNSSLNLSYNYAYYRDNTVTQNKDAVRNRIWLGLNIDFPVTR